MAKMRTLLVFLALVAVSSALKMPIGDPVTAIEGLVSRILGEKYVAEFVYEVIRPDSESGHDIFEIDANATTKKPVLRGNNGVAFASALNFYLKYNCNCSISWGRDGTGDQLNLPQPLPLPTSVKRMVSPVKYRCSYRPRLPGVHAYMYIYTRIYEPPMLAWAAHTHTLFMYTL